MTKLPGNPHPHPAPLTRKGFAIRAGITFQMTETQARTREQGD